MKLNRILPLIGLLISINACAQEGVSTEPYQEGVHYQKIPSAPAAPRNSVSVVEVFSYMCPHCNSFQPHVNAWHEDLPEYVNFSRLPVSWQNWEPFARGYYTAEALGIVEDAHQPMFDRIHTERKFLRNMDQIAEFYSAFDVSKDAFLETANSFAVDMKMRQSVKLAQDWGVTGTPSIVVNGRYRIASTRELGQAGMIAVTRYLVEKEYAAMQEAAEAADEQVAEAAQ